MMRLGIILGVALVAALCCSPSLALNTKVYSLSEHNLSIDLGSGFEVTKKEVDSSSNGSLVQNLMVANSQIKGVAVLQIIVLYDEALKAIKPAVISELWLDGALGAAVQDNGTMMGNWSTADIRGTNVTIYTINSTATPLKHLGGTVEIANWRVGENMYMGMMSFFDKNITRQIVKTLAVSEAGV
jgi:hypothetical protein